MPVESEGRRLARLWAARLIEESGLGSGDAALDLGCGSGGFTSLLASESGALVLGLDRRAAGLPRERGAGARFVVGDAAALPIRDGALRLVFLSHVAHHLGDPAAALREAHRCLAPGGRCLIRTLSHAQLRERAEYRFFPTALALALKQAPDSAEILAWMARAGFGGLEQSVVAHPSAWTLGELAERARSGLLPSATVGSPEELLEGAAALEALVQSSGPGARPMEEYTVLRGLRL